MQPTRFVIDDRTEPSEGASVAVAEGAQRASAWLSWVELALLMPTRLVAAFSWLLVPLLVFAAVPLVILGTLLLLQAPIFFALWKLCGSAPLTARSSEETTNHQ